MTTTGVMLIVGWAMAAQGTVMKEYLREPAEGAIPHLQGSIMLAAAISKIISSMGIWIFLITGIYAAATMTLDLLGYPAS